MQKLILPLIMTLILLGGGYLQATATELPADPTFISEEDLANTPSLPKASPAPASLPPVHENKETDAPVITPSVSTHPSTESPSHSPQMTKMPGLKSDKLLTPSSQGQSAMTPVVGEKSTLTTGSTSSLPPKTEATNPAVSNTVPVSSPSVQKEAKPVQENEEAPLENAHKEKEAPIPAEEKEMKQKDEKMQAEVEAPLPPSLKPDDTAAQASSPTEKLATAKVVSGKSGKQQSLKELLTWKGSLFYKEDQVSALYEALEIAVHGKKGGTFNAILEPKQTAPQAANTAPTLNAAPVFYLNSLMYASSTDWAIWVNGRKISYAGMKAHLERIPSLEIIKVSSQEVHFMWKTSFLNDVAPNWQEKLTEDDNGEFVSEDYDISVNKEGNGVYFTLRPNQTFIAKDMQVLEGNIKSAAIK